jgi:lipopolysaccharide biosynthesis protein
MRDAASWIGVVGRTYWAAKSLGMRSVAALDAVRRWRNRREPGVRRVIDGDVAPRSRSFLCIFSHFDRNDVIDDYVVHYVKQLSASGCEVIFVSAAEGLPDHECNKLKPFTRQIIVRDNIGHDFGSWKTAICRELAASDTAFSGYAGLITANDSVYGPLRPLAPILAEMSARECDFWGITDSWQYFHHVQSYFTLFKQPVIESDVFRRFWFDMPFCRSKHVVIWKGEVGLSRALTEAGFEFDVLCRYEDLRASNESAISEVERRKAFGRTVNSTHYFWDLLLKEHRCPFLKVQLLRDNPKNVENVRGWMEILSDCDFGLQDEIKRHLVRMGART